MNRTILYWKWDESILEADVKAEVQDLIDRCTLDTIYLKYDSMKPPISYKDKKLKSLLRVTAEMLQASGKSLWLDVDPRGEAEDFLQRYPEKENQFLCFYETELDDSGEGVIKIPYTKNSKSSIKVGNAWVLQKIDSCNFADGSLQTVKPTIEEGENELIVSLNTDAKYAGLTFIVVVTLDTGRIDLFSQECIEYAKEMITYFADLPICGMATDEWGLGAFCDIENGVWVCKKFSFSNDFRMEFEKKYGINFFENAIYMAYKSTQTEQISNTFISNYLALIRENLCRSNDAYYDAVKQAIGQDALIGAHPTFWGDAYDYTFDAIANGLHWWEMKRDIAQTDEEVIMPIRLAMSRKFGDGVWYNMWYGMKSPHLMTFYAEAWKDLRFCGKVHYLGWDTKYEPWHCFFKYPNGEIEQVNAMEGKIEEAFAHITSVPDSSVLIVFGIDAVTNWLKNFHQAKIVRAKGRFTKALMLAQGVFNACNCDMVPSSEIENGSVKIENGKAVYGNQAYEAVIFVYPEDLPQKTENFVREYARIGTLIAIGDGAEEYPEAYKSCKELPQAYHVIDWLRNAKVNFHRVGRGCEYRDGTVVFTANANLPVGNYLEEDFTWADKEYSFKGYDYLIINPKEGTAYFDKNSKLTIRKK